MDRDVYFRMDELQAEHWWFKSRRKILTKLLSRTLPSDAQILEVGCGTGGNLEMLSQFGTVTGFEHNEEALELARQKGSFDLRQGTLPHGIHDYKNPFDAIVAFDVIEHIEDDTTSVNVLKTLLNSGGPMIVTVPAFSFLWSRHDETHHHHRRYNKDSLTNLFTDAGFEMAYCSYFNTLLFPPIALARLLQKLVGAKGDGDDAMPNPAVNRLLGFIFSLERFWVGRFAVPFGVSLIAVVRKP